MSWPFKVIQGLDFGTNLKHACDLVLVTNGARTNRLWTHSLQLDRPTYAPASQTMAFSPQYSPATTHYV